MSQRRAGGIGVLNEGGEWPDEWSKAVMDFPEDMIEMSLSRMTPIQRLRLCVFDPSLDTAHFPCFRSDILNVRVKIYCTGCVITIKTNSFDDSITYRFTAMRARVALARLAASLRRFCVHADVFAYVIDMAEPAEYDDIMLSVASQQGGIRPNRVLIRGLPLPVLNIDELFDIERVMINTKCPSITAASLHVLRKVVEDVGTTLACLDVHVSKAIAFAFLRVSLDVKVTDIGRRNKIGYPRSFFYWDRRVCQIHASCSPSSNQPLGDIIHSTIGVISSIHYMEQDIYKIHIESWNGTGLGYLVRDFVPLEAGEPYYINP